MTHTERLHALLQTFDGAMRDVLKHAIKERDEFWAKELEALKESLGDCGNAMLAEGNKALRLRDALQSERERCDQMAALLSELEDQRLIAWILKSWWERRDKILTIWKASRDE